MFLTRLTENANNLRTAAPGRLVKRTPLIPILLTITMDSISNTRTYGRTDASNKITHKHIKRTHQTSSYLCVHVSVGGEEEGSDSNMSPPRSPVQ